MSKWAIVLTTALCVLVAGAATYASLNLDPPVVEQEEVDRGACTSGCG